MSYDISSLFSVSSCRVVFADSEELAKKLSDSILQTAPEYALEISPVFSPSKKLGPIRIKNKKTLWNILWKTKEAQTEDNAWLLKQMNDMDLRYYDGRFPASLSNGQRLRASMLYEALNGRNKFLINDYTAFAANNGYTFANWLETRKTAELIWITKLSREEIAEKLGEERLNSSFFTFFTISQNNVEKCEAPKYVKKEDQYPVSQTPAQSEISVEHNEDSVQDKLFNSNTNPNKEEAERLFKEGEKYDRFFLTMNPGEFDDPAKAMRLYEDAAKLGNLDAQIRLGYIQATGRRSGEINPVGAVYWYTMAVCNDYYSVFNKNKKYAWDFLRKILRQVPESEKYIRQYAGDKSDDVISQIRKDIEDMEYIHKFLDKTFNKF